MQAVDMLKGEARELFETGRAALSRFDLPEATDAMQRCVALAPNSVDALHYLGMALLAREPHRTAEVLDRALDLQPTHLGALYTRAEAEWFQGNPAAAAPFLRRLAELAPHSGNFGRLGFALLDAGAPEAAGLAFEKAVSIGETMAGSHPWELRCAYYLEALGRQAEADRLVRAVNGAGIFADYPAARYPRDLEVQRCALEDLVAGRDIVVLGSGPSLETLQPVLAELGPDGTRDLCFFGFNNVPVQERLLVDAIGRGVDLACMTSANVMELHHDWIARFLDRDPRSSLFLTLADSLPAGRPTADMIRARPERVFFFAAAGDYPPIPDDPLHFPPVNTLMCVLPAAVMAQPRRIFLFGCDGAVSAGRDGGGAVYFRQGSAEYGKQNTAIPQYARWLERDTFFQNAMLPTVLRCLSVLHRVPIARIYNCNPQSAYTGFEKIAPAEFLRLYRESAPTGDSFPARQSQLERQQVLPRRRPRVTLLRRAGGRLRRALARLLRIG